MESIGLISWRENAISLLNPHPNKPNSTT